MLIYRVIYMRVSLYFQKLTLLRINFYPIYYKQILIYIIALREINSVFIETKLVAYFQNSDARTYVRVCVYLHTRVDYI